MDDRQLGPVEVEVGSCRLLVDTELPLLFDEYVKRAAFADTSGLTSPDGATLFVGARGDGAWPDVVIAFRYEPAGYGFTPGVTFVPETNLLFVGAGTTLRCYSLAEKAHRLWSDEADFGFWNWRRCGDRLLMAAELELAAWDIHGNKLWTTFVEPPWEYEVDGDTVRLDVMGTISDFPITSGPDWEKLPWR